MCSRTCHLVLCKCTLISRWWQNHLPMHFSDLFLSLSGTWLCLCVYIYKIFGVICKFPQIYSNITIKRWKTCHHPNRICCGAHLNKTCPICKLNTKKNEKDWIAFLLFITHSYYFCFPFFHMCWTSKHMKMKLEQNGLWGFCGSLKQKTSSHSYTKKMLKICHIYFYMQLGYYSK